MAKKYLPIQFFEKRKDFDDRLTEGGGDSRPPSWVLTGKALISRSNQLTNLVSTMQDNFIQQKKKGRKLPLVVSTTIEEKAIAKSHRYNISALYADNSHHNVLGFSGNRCLLTMISNEAVFKRINNVLSDIGNQAKVISSITHISPYTPAIDDFNEDVPYYKIRLINYNNFDLNTTVKILFEQYCAERGITIIRKSKFTPDMPIYRICPDSAEQLSALGGFEGIYTIEQMIPIEVALDAFGYAYTVPPKEPQDGEDYPIVGVLDTGIAENDYLKQWKTPTSFTNYPEEYKNRSHGTFVSGIIEYGDELNSSSYTLMPGVRLFDATIYPDINKESIYIDEIIDHIREAIERNSDIKIWNLSLGTDKEADLDQFSDFGIALDSIQDEYNVLIVKSAGNCYNFKRQLPKSRIAQSADSVRALVVGSLAHRKGVHDYAEPDMPSPFTRIGPGPSSIIKPDLVFYGGNAGMDGDNLCTTGVPSFSVSGQITKMPGTSFSTPWITRMAAELMYLMKEEFDPLLIRALMIHNAKYPSNCGMNMADKVAQMGFGMPSSVQETLYNSENEITLILRDTLDKGSYIEMFDFPYPTSLVDENGYFSGQIIVTLVTKSLVDEKQAGEYCQSNIDVLFGTYETEVNRDITKPTIKNPKGLGEPQNILLDSCYSARAKNAYPHTGFERECVLVKYGKKFHPVKKYAVDLADMTPSNRMRFLVHNRKWYLKIDGLFRNFIEQDAIEHNYQLSQEFCLLLTIRDPKGVVPVYDEVSQQLDIKNFIHHNIRLRNTISIDGNQ